MKPTKRIFAAALAALIVAGAGTTLATQVPQLTNSIAHAAEGVIASGFCGAEGNKENVTWTLTTNSEDSTKYILTISGKGAMADYSYGSTPWSWYSYKDKITTIVIEDGVTSIGSGAFYECTNLKTVTFGKDSQLASIGNSVFGYCTSLTSIDIPTSVTSIGDWAFSECTSLTSIEIPDSVTSIGNYAFYNCTNLKTVTFGKDSQLASIGYCAFGICESLTSITIPSSVTSIGNYAFYNCANLETVTMQNSTSAPTLGVNVFENSGLKTILVPTGSYGIYQKTDGWSSYVDRIANGFCGSTGHETDVTWALKENENEGTSGENITYTLIISGTGAMADYSYGSTPWYSNGNKITKIVIEEGVTSIGSGAFYECDGLTSIKIPDSVTSIGDSAFSNCTGLTSITIPNSVTSIGRGAFYNCCNLTTVIFENESQLSSIGGSAFKETAWLKAEQKKNNGLVIVNNLLLDGTTAGAVTIPNNVTQICDEAFLYNKNITTVTFENSSKLSSIGEWAFYECTNLKTVTFGKDSQLASIGDGAFWGCESLTSITIPASVTSISLGVFDHCSKLEKVTFGKDSQLTSIGDGAFEFCSNLKEITIPESVAKIGMYAFSSCKNLATVTMQGTKPPIMGRNVFGQCKFVTGKSKGITVPYGSLEKYKGAENWSDYKDYMKEAPAPYVPSTPSDSTVTKPTTKDENGNTVTGTIVTHPDGSVTDTTIVTKPNGDTTKTVVEKDPQGNTTKTTVTKVETTADGTKTETETITEADKTPVTTKTTTKKDGSQTVEKTTSAENSRGNMVQTTETVVKDSDGDVVEKTTQKEIKNIGSQTDAVIDVDNNTATINKTGATKSNGVQATLTNKVVSQLKEANDGKNLNLTMNVKDKDGNDRYSVEVNTADLTAKNKLYLYKKDSKTGELLLVNSKAYKTDSKGQLKLVIRSKGDFVLKNAEDAAKINQQILDSVKAKKNKVTLSKSKTATFAFSDELDLRNVKSVTYTSSKPSVATVNANGKIKGKKAGTTTITATITLKNGETKTLTMKVTVK